MSKASRTRGSSQIVAGMDVDLEVNLDLVDITSVQSDVLEQLRGVIGHSIVISNEVWRDLHTALASYVAQERFRRLMPNKTQAKSLESIKSAATQLLRRLRASMTPPKKGETRPRSTEFDRFVADKLPTGSVDGLMTCLGALSKMSARTVLYDNPAPELDRRLRNIWERMSGEVATVHKAEERRSHYDQFFQIVAGAIPAELLPGDSAGSLANRPKQLVLQDAERTEASKELESMVNQLAAKLAAKGQG